MPKISFSGREAAGPRYIRAAHIHDRARARCRHLNEIDDQFALVQAVLSPERINLEAIHATPFFNYRSSRPGETDHVGWSKEIWDIPRWAGYSMQTGRRACWRRPRC